MPPKAKKTTRVTRGRPQSSDSGPSVMPVGATKIPSKYIWREHPEYRGAISKLKKQVDSSSLSAQEEASPFKDDLSERIPRSEVDEHIKFIRRFAPTVIGAGSYRRRAITSNDIDVIIREPIEPLLRSLDAAGYIKHTFAAGDRKFLGVVKHPGMPRFRHLDIIVTNDQNYPFALLYFTGSAQHNIIMRVRAKRLGLKLNEYGLFKDDVPVQGIKSEEDIFAQLNIVYKPPEER